MEATESFEYIFFLLVVKYIFTFWTADFIIAQI